MAARIFTFQPSNAGEAARILAACTRLAEQGRSISVAIAESPDAAIAPAPEIPSSLDDLERLAAGDPARVVLSHSAMNRVREISKEDFLAVVEGGARFGDFAAAVRDAGLFFPHAADGATRGTTIAGLVMAGAKFPTEERFGRLREHILSLELVIPKGEIVRAGSRSVKDVTGYDLIAFAVGAGGRCGMIARATLRLLPRPFDGARGSMSGPSKVESAPTASVVAAPGRKEAALGAGTNRFEDRLALPAALRGLDERVYDVLDPAGIMKPPAPGVEWNVNASRRRP